MSLPSNRAMRYVYLRTLPLAQQPAVTDAPDVVAQIEGVTTRLCGQHLARATDSRAEIHLHMGALAIATHRVLSPLVKDDLAVENMIRAAFGAQLLPADGGDAPEAPRLPAFWIARAALMFSFDRMATVRKMVANVAKDFGETFEAEAADEEEGDVHRLVVRKCFYHAMCQAEEVPRLTKVFCALDRGLFNPISPKAHGVGFALTETLADERETDGKCNFVFTKVKAKS